MPTDEYRSTPGGALKLKGSKISKRSHHHNKKKRPKPPSPSPPPPPQSPPLQQPAEDEEQRQQKHDDGPLSKRRLVPVANNNNNNNNNGEKKQNEDRVEKDEGRDDAAELEDGDSVAAVHTEGDKKGIWAVGKTEAERRHEEQRRKRVRFFFSPTLSLPYPPHSSPLPPFFPKRTARKERKNKGKKNTSPFEKKKKTA